ncbi:hypothetical protein [Nocardia terpenica]|uniref:hypothetical protein n=1 Tax=Nocardia terpenica TaxID=455432 RepID=UPI0012FD2CCF|nr:hypothetical protein [Nocardia terpenica]
MSTEVDQFPGLECSGGADGVGRVFFCGEYHPLAARVMLAEIDAANEFLVDARRYALDVLRAIDGGADAAAVWAQIRAGGRALRRSAPVGEVL